MQSLTELGNSSQIFRKNSLSEEERTRIENACSNLMSYVVVSLSTYIDKFVIGVKTLNDIELVLQALHTLKGFSKGGDGNHYYNGCLVAIEVEGDAVACT